ncbi:MAG: NAD(P)-dependent oxidoreductase [Acetobacter papayae]|uniref:NAD(P)-dependent oxidoreductase n=1 Tax=Acetobacter papayae TaxID=1076592 RepID=UPI0039EA6C8C
MDATYNLNGGFKPTLKRYADLNGPDFYPTPAWATHALIENEQFDGEIWEPACGNGAMSQVLQTTGCPVKSSDLYERGYGEAGVDFLDTDYSATNIVTNPPFHSAEGFIFRGLDLANKKFALLLRLAFLEGGKRATTIFQKIPPTRVWVFSERITFYPAGMKATSSGTTAYAWFVWDKENMGQTELKWFAPGYKARFSDEKASKQKKNINPMLF